MAYGVRCGECDAKFALSDELFARKVKGRVVTVRCKQCQSDITVDGVELASTPLSGRPMPLEESAIDGGPEDGTPTIPLVIKSGRNTIPPVKGLWLVSFGADDDRELTAAQIRRALERQEIDKETIVWREGMPDWLPIAEIPDLSKLVPDDTGGFLGTGMEVRGADAALQAALKKAKTRRPTLAPPPSDPSSPKVAPPPAAAEAPKAADNAAPQEEDEVGPFRSEGSGTFEVEESDAPVSSAPMSLGDADVEMIASDAKPKAKSPPPPKAQPKPSPGTAKPKQLRPDPGDDADSAPDSGTPDLRSLTTSLKPPVRKRDTSERVDESLLTLGAGPIVDAAFSPPTIDLVSAPVAEDESDADRGSEPPKKSGTGGTTRSTPARVAAADSESKSSPMLWLLLAAAAIVAVVFWVGRKPADGSASTASTSTATTTETTSQPTGEPAPTLTAETPEPELTASAETTPAKPTGTAGTAGAAGTATSTGGGPINTDPKDPKEPVPTEEPKDPKEPTDPKEPKEPTEEPTKEVPLAGPFDTGAARSALNAAAGSASGCRQEGDPSGTATVVVTFATSGRVTSATVNGPPFAGTRTGGCIASRMRSARVPPFSGSPITVSKTVTIQ